MSQPPANPYPSQPDPGSPYGSPQHGQQYGSPQSSQPYGDQQYGQQYGTPQPGQQYGDPVSAVPPKKKSKAGKVLLIVLASVLALCLGGSAIAYFSFKDEAKELVDASNTRLVEPATLGGRPKATQPELQAASTEMASSIKQDVPEATSTLGAFYGDPAKQDLVMVVGASGVFVSPTKELDEMIKALTADLGLTNLASVEPGPLGGEAKCGDGKSEGVPLGVCAWADRGSVAMIVHYFKSADGAKAEFVALRGELEKRS